MVKENLYIFLTKLFSKVKIFLQKLRENELLMEGCQITLTITIAFIVLVFLRVVGKKLGWL